MASIEKILATLKANAITNLANHQLFAANLPQHQYRVVINEHQVSAYALLCKGRAKLKNWATVRWYLNSNPISYINLIKKLKKAA
jgi:hypothetical protein